MKTSRLKKIIIVLLLLVNAFLLTLLWSRRAQERAAYERKVAQLTALYASNGIALSPSLLPGDARLDAVDPARDLDAEAAFAKSLLGAAAANDAGGGIYRYVSASGQCLIRSSGAVRAAMDRAVNDPESFCADLFSSYGYAQRSSTLAGGSGTVTAVRTINSYAVFNAVLELTFSQNRLLSVAGSFLSAVEAVEGTEGLDAVTALVRFLDYSTRSGEVCTEITGVECGYLLQSTASATLRLIPAWRVDTDVNSYYVNFVNGEITRGG